MRLQDLQKPYGELLIETEARILSALRNGTDAEMAALIEAAPIRGGKKVRSTFLFMLLAEAGVTADAAVDIAAAIEMIHQASLIHDDVLDHAQTRRDQPTLHHVVDNTLAVLVGDYIFMRAFELVQRLGRDDLMRTVLTAGRELVFGQIADMRPTQSPADAFREYIFVLERKTGALFAAAAEMAARLRGQAEEILAASRRFGLSFGVLFQLQDDVMDMFSDKTGKDRWNDLREGKWTLPTLLLRECAPALEIFPFREERAASIDAALTECGILERCRQTVQTYRQRTLNCLAEYAGPASDRALTGLIDYVCQRQR